MSACGGFECPRQAHARGLCKVHAQMQAEGLGINAKGVREARYLSLTVPNGECWDWLGAINPEGYGLLGHSQKAYRWFYEHFVSEVPKDLVIDHLCRNRACVNPKHLEPVSRTENILRGYRDRGFGEDRQFCANGHSWSENVIETRRSRDGSMNRSCRTCKRASWHKWAAKKRVTS